MFAGFQVIARSTVVVEKKKCLALKITNVFPKTIKIMEETDRFITRRQLEQTPAMKSQCGGVMTRTAGMS